MKLILKYAIFILIIGIVLSVGLKSLDLEVVKEFVNKVNLFDLLFLISISLVLLFTKIFRFDLLLQAIDIKLGLLKAAKVFIASQTLTSLPGGEMGRTLVLHKESGISIEKGTGPVFAQAYLEIFAPTILLLIVSFFDDEFFSYAIILFIVSLISLVFVTQTWLLSWIKNKFKNINIIQKFVPRVEKAQHYIRQVVLSKKSNFPRGTFYRAFLLAVISNIIGGILLWRTAQSFGVSLEVGSAIYVYIAGVLLQGIGSFSPGGLGITEGGMTALLMANGINYSESLSLVIVFRVLTYFIYVLAGLLLIIIFYRKDLLYAEAPASN